MERLFATLNPARLRPVLLLPFEIRCTVVLTGILTAFLWSGLLGSRATGQERRATPSFDFSAGNAGEVLNPDPQFWTDINRFVFLFGGDTYPPSSTDAPSLNNAFGGIESYPKLRMACRKWQQYTFRTLQDLAQRLSTGEIPLLLEKLESAVKLRTKDPELALRTFDESAHQLSLQLSYLDESTKNVKQDLESLVSLTFAASIQLQGMIAALPPGSRTRETLEKSQARLKSAASALSGVHDRWSAVNSDLAALRKEMGTNLSSRDAFDLAIAIDVGRASWDAVQRVAKTFVANGRMQSKYLTGENYYDESPVREDVWYFLESKYSPAWRFQKVSGDMRAQRIMTTDKPPQWARVKFLKQSGGWWQIVTADGQPGMGISAGPENALPPGTCFPNDIKVTYSYPCSTEGHRDLFWRFLPANEKGWFYLVNYTVGEFSALTADWTTCERLGPPNRPILMRDFKNVPKERPGLQYWRVLEAK